jgi:hypothetical protein
MNRVFLSRVFAIIISVFSFQSCRTSSPMYMNKNGWRNRTVTFLPGNEDAIVLQNVISTHMINNDSIYFSKYVELDSAQMQSIYFVADSLRKHRRFFDRYFYSTANRACDFGKAAGVEDVMYIDIVYGKPDTMMVSVENTENYPILEQIIGRKVDNPDYIDKPVAVQHPKKIKIYYMDIKHEKVLWKMKKGRNLFEDKSYVAQMRNAFEKFEKKFPYKLHK